MSEWDDWVDARKTSEKQLRRQVRREMWDELGFSWFDFGPMVGDACLSMVTLSKTQIAIFQRELDRRVTELMKEE